MLGGAQAAVRMARGAGRIVAAARARRVASLQAAAGGLHAGAELPPVAGEPCKRVLYDTHMPTSPTQKILLSFVSAFTVFANPERGDMLATLGEVTGREALQRVHARMCSDPVGTRILVEQPTIRSDQIDFDYLRNLPKDTFGYAYSQFMDAHGFEADGRAYVKYIDDPELAYVMQRYRELHDFWHTLFGLPPTVFGEIILKYVELVQTGLPHCALSGFVGPLRLESAERKRLVTEYIPWANEAGHQAKFLMNVYYEKEFETPLEELRTRLNILPPPPV
ncbi:hypothetical protein Poli38472_010028 [Pythium oligandrum]|uniref:Ubiquinone biosynthesis protein COQ4 homolog, mitochondrial n=1 Tax=Pythium oligandrum TaxID=41045 RepID=A0A8K1FEZ4_PYTOL|nr:hypothetical protein Poli38472_010028 [Pythium oligandrum]|eukprot:TMW58469.1 hypothetical protein Poli38472_010028 [Pythium oligandrum]